MNRIFYYTLILSLFQSSYIFAQIGVSNCSKPTNVTAVLTANNGVILSWDAPADVSKFIITGGMKDSKERASFKVRSSGVTIPKLLKCVTYEVEVTSICAFNNKKLTSDKITFTTSGCVNCDAPSSLSNSVGHDNATLQWNVVQNASAYILEGKDSSMDDFIHIYTRDNSYEASGLKPGNEYEWRVRSVCSYQEGEASSSSYFITYIPKANIARETTEDVNVELYPNPVNQVAKIRFEGIETAIGEYSVIDLSGRTLLEGAILLENKNEMQLDVAHLQKGVYIITIEINNQILTRRFTIYR